MNRKKGFVLTIVFIGLILFNGCKSKEEEAKVSDLISVKTEKIMKEKIALPIHTSGKISTSTETKLSFKIGGIIEKIFVNEGDYVQKGKLLARLNQSEIEARVIQAQNGFEKAERDFNRVKKLYDDEVATLEQYQNVETAKNVAKSDLEIALFNSKHTKINAPSDGRILKKLNEENELTSPGAPLFFFGSQSSGWIIRVGITDKDILKINSGDSAHVVVDAFPGKVFSASVTETGRSANPYNGTYEVELKIDNEKYNFVSGFVAKVDIFPSKSNEYFMVPIAALNEADNTGGIVYVPEEDNSVKKLYVQVDAIVKEYLAVSGGLENIESVITNGSEYLNSFSKINIVK